MLSWTRPQGSQHLTFWFQVSQFGWARYTGSKFTVEFQLWMRPEVGASLQRARLPELLNDSDWDEVRQRQNRVISRLVRPPRSYLESMRSVSVDFESLLSRQFDLVDKPYEKGTDIWLRYASEDDARAWCELIKAKLPAAIAKFLASAGSTEGHEPRRLSD